MKRLVLTIALVSACVPLQKAIALPSFKDISERLNSLSWNEKISATCFAGAGLYAVFHPKQLFNGTLCIKRWAGEHPGIATIGLASYGAGLLKYPRISLGALGLNLALIHQYQYTIEEQKKYWADQEREHQKCKDDIENNVPKPISPNLGLSLTDDMLDITHAKEILDKDHFGLKEIKERILDYIAIRKLTNNNKALILCFVGPPGTGKTSFAKSIASCLNKNFTRISVGGIWSEAEIRGYDKSYQAAKPGQIIKGLEKAGSLNPVFLIDEIDKMGNSSHGDPSAALLEVLDPEQNSTFLDRYLEKPVDLSNVLFVATANSLNTIPQPLLDRMEILEVSGYSLEEKVTIAKNYLVSKAVTSAGIQELTFSDEVLTILIQEYTLESGVRELERLLKKLCSKAARALIEDNQLIGFTPDNLEQYLGPKKFIKDDSGKESLVGITNGLGWTSFGGVMLKVEAVIVPGTGKLLLTGSLGSVMKESAEAAMTYARAHAAEYKISQKMFTDYDMHIHLPEGAIPKDGPSAGITMLCSIISAFTGRKIDVNYAMTGELNLRGNIMPIGGVKEKILVAKRNGITNIILPMKNKHNLVDLEDVIHGMKILFVKHADEVLTHVLMPK